MSAARHLKHIRFEAIDDEDRSRERAVKESWYDVRSALGRGDGLAHKVQSFLVPHGQIHTLCGKNIFAAWPTRPTSDPQRVYRMVTRLKCRRCEAEILSGRWVYPCSE